MPRPGPSVTSGADLQPGSDSLFPSGFTGGGAKPSAGSVGTGEIADGSVAAADLNLSSVAAAIAARSEFTGTYAQPAGAWSAGTYSVNQVVTYNGSTYRSKVNGNTATPGTDTSKWELWGGGASDSTKADLVSGKVPTTQLGSGTADSTKLLAGDQTWASAVTLAQSGQTPSQAPVTAATAASVGSQTFAARSDHVHPDAHPYALPMDSGRWWRLPFVTVSSSWAGLGSGTVAFLRFPVGAACSIAAMGINVTTAQASGLARLGIYSDNAGAPGALLKDYGTVGTDTTGYKTTGATTALALSPGWIWLAVGMEGTFSAQQFDTLSQQYNYIGAATLGGNACGYNGSGYAGGGLPATASTLTSFTPSIRTFFPWVQTA